MFYLLRSELFRLRKRPQTWLLLLIAFALTAMLYAGFAVGSRVTDPQDSAELKDVLTFPSLDDFGLSIGLGFFGSVMVVIIAAGMMGNEYGWNTLRPLTARARSRSGLLTAKLLTAVLYSALFMAVLAVLVGGLSLLGSAIAGVDAQVSANAVADAARFTGKVVLVNLPYVALAFMLATVARSNVAGIAGTLGVSFIEQPIFQLLKLASGIFDDVERYGISWNTNVILFPQDGDELTGPVIILLAYMVLFGAISYATFLRRDVTSG